MTNRQSNIIFYIIISLIVYALIINYINPTFFENLSKSKEELLLQDAVKNGNHNEALKLYEGLVQERKNDGNEYTAEIASMYEEMAKLYSLLGNKIVEKKYYLQSIELKKKLKKVDVFGFADTYEKLGTLAENEQEYDEAQMYYEKALAKRLGETEKVKDEGMINGMHQSRMDYKRLNNEVTIITFKKLANVHNIKKEYDIAKSYYEKALTASKLTFGEEDVKTLEIMKLMNLITL